MMLNTRPTSHGEISYINWNEILSNFDVTFVAIDIKYIAIDMEYPANDVEYLATDIAYMASRSWRNTLHQKEMYRIPPLI